MRQQSEQSFFALTWDRERSQKHSWTERFFWNKQCELSLSARGLDMANGFTLYQTMTNEWKFDFSGYTRVLKMFEAKQNEISERVSSKNYLEIWYWVICKDKISESVIVIYIIFSI